MAILTEQQDNAMQLFSQANPQAFAALVGGLNQKFGPSNDFEYLIQSFQIQAPDRWLSFITALVANYTATTADVEREVGKKTLEKIGQNQPGYEPPFEGDTPKQADERRARNKFRQDRAEAVESGLYDRNQARNDRDESLRERLRNAEQNPTGIQLDAARAQGLEEAIQEGRAQDLINRRVNEIRKMLDSACRQSMICNYSTRTARNGIRLAQQVELLTRKTRLAAKSQESKIAELVQQARVLDGSTDYVPSTTALELVFENYLG